MSRFRKYLTEDAIDLELIEKIEPSLRKNCMQALREIKKGGGLVYRGVRNPPNSSNPIKAKITRKDRTPRFIPMPLHEYMDELTKKYWGWKGRSEAVFTANHDLANNFGTASIFIPKDGYKYRWIGGKSVTMLYNMYDDITLATSGSHDFEELKRRMQHEPGVSVEHLENLEEIVKSYANRKVFNKNITQNITFEALFNCDGYYLIWSPLYAEVLEIARRI